MVQTNHAIVIKGPGEAAIEEVSIPTCPPDYILVQVVAIALNPTDWKHRDYLPSPNVRVGCDYSGTVLKVGSAVTKPFKVGDRIAGFTHGSNALHPEYGSFAQIIVAKGDAQIKIPEHLSFEDAATLGVGVTTVGQGLYQSLKLPLPPAKPDTPPKDILIYGGSTATGGLAIQFAKLSGYRVLTTCSESNFGYVKDAGADEAFDYRSESVVEDIKRASGGKLALVFDCISGGDSPKISVSSMGPEGGIYATLVPMDSKDVKAINEKVELRLTLAYTALGEDAKLGSLELPAKKEDYEFAKQFWERARELLVEGKLKVHPASVNEGEKGLEGALAGLDLLKTGKVSGKKLVYTL